jgi:hypothetical protein
MSRPSLKQGTSRTVRAFNIVDGADQPLTVTGWLVHGVARADNDEGPVLAEWSDTPTGFQGRATASGRTVNLFITPAMSLAWVCDRVVIQAKITNPLDATQVERIIDVVYDFDREVIPA